MNGYQKSYENFDEGRDVASNFTTIFDVESMQRTEKMIRRVLRCSCLILSTKAREPIETACGMQVALFMRFLDYLFRQDTSRNAKGLP